MIWDVNGNLIASGRAPLDLSTPATGYGEQDPLQWWTATCAAVRSAMKAISGDSVVAMCIAHQRESFACLDAAGDAIRPAMLWLDSRATAEVESAGTLRVHQVTGKPPNPTPAFYKLLWLRKHEPESMQKTAHVVDVHGYLVNKMTDRWRTSIASADPLGLVNLVTGDYDDELISQAGLTRDQLSELVPAGDVIGELTAVAAVALGLPVGLTVIAGAGDGQTAALGADISQPGRAYLNLGTGLVAGCFSATYKADQAYRALTGLIRGTFSFEIFIGAGTYMINWFVDTFVGQRGSDTNDVGTIELRLEREAESVSPGSQGLFVVPYWNGALTPYWDHNARGVMLGFSGVHDRAHIYRAILEGLAFELRLCLERVDASLADPISSLVAMGGGAQSALWCQILSDVLGRPIVVSEQQESTSLGAGMLAAAGVGLYPDIGAASKAMSAFGTTYFPDATVSPIYDRLFTVYREIYPSTRDVFARLAQVRE